MSTDLENSIDSIDDTVCHICWEKITPGTQAELFCCHKKVYCNNCITAWLLQKQTCPFCLEKYDVKYFDRNKTLVSFDRNRGTDLLDMIRRPDEENTGEENNDEENNQNYNDILNNELESMGEGSEFSTRSLRRPNLMDVVKRCLGLVCILIILISTLTPLILYITKPRDKEK